MSTIKQGILGPFSGKVGTVIGGSWNGIAYMRGIAASINNPRTPAQLDQRAKFSTVIKFLRPLTAFLRFGFRSQAVRMSGFNAAMAYNLKNAISGTYPAYEIDYSKALVSRGSLPGALNPGAVAGATGQINFTWDDNSLDTNSMPDDKAVLVIYNSFRNQVVTVIGSSTRASGMDSITLPVQFTGENVECYIAFTDATESVTSDSQWVARITVA